jgi:hypothetical protein
VDWLAACIALRVVGEEMSQTLLTNKKQGNLDSVHVSNIISKLKLALTARNTVFFIKSMEHFKKGKNGRIPYLGLEPPIRVIISQIHLVRQSLSASNSKPIKNFYLWKICRLPITGGCSY